jgi:hypothetical protein
MKRDAVSPFRDKLWKLFEEHAKGMDGRDIVIALDITWLTVVCIKLKEMKSGRRPRVRAKHS